MTDIHPIEADISELLERGKGALNDNEVNEAKACAKECRSIMRQYALAPSVFQRLDRKVKRLERKVERAESKS